MNPESSEGIRYFEEKVSILAVPITSFFEIILVLSIIFTEQNRMIAIFLAALLLFLLGNIYSYRVIIDFDSIYTKLGVGLWVQEIPIPSIESFAIVENSSVRGWLYNPFRSHVLQLKLRTGETVILPVSEPKGVLELLRGR